MALDENSLYLAIGFSGVSLALTFLASWLSARSEKFMLTWALGALVLVGNTFVYSAYGRAPTLALGAVAFGLLVVAFSLVLVAAHQFRGTPVPVASVMAMAGVSLLAVLAPFAIGYDGLGMIAANAVSAFLVFQSLRIYWSCRHEAPVPMIGLVALYGANVLSFVLCAGVLIVEGELVRGGPPQNWAENISLVVYTIGLTGIGALSLALNQWRLARRHQRDAATDALTGLLNRRALFDLYGAHSLPTGTGVIVFDVDRFKRINDRHGHAIGDDVIRRFAAVLDQSRRPGDSAARLGGEEFALVLPRISREALDAVAERVRHAFAAETILSEDGDVRSTVSAGVVFVDDPGYSFDSVLSLADDALYAAKRDGRDRVVRTAMDRPVNKETVNANAYRPGQLAGNSG